MVTARGAKPSAAQLLTEARESHPQKLAVEGEGDSAALLLPVHHH